MSDTSDQQPLYCVNCLKDMETDYSTQRIQGAELRTWKCAVCHRILATLRIENGSKIQVNMPLSPARPDDGPATQHRPDYF